MLEVLLFIVIAIIAIYFIGAFFSAIGGVLALLYVGIDTIKNRKNSNTMRRYGLPNNPVPVSRTSTDNPFSDQVVSLVAEPHISVTVSPVTYTPSECGQEISELSKQATKLKGEGNTDKAIECLKLANEKLRTCSTDFPIQQWLRLPKFLTDAGRYDEAIEEFNLIKTDIEQKKVGRGNKYLQHSDLSELYECMEYTCQLQKNEAAAKECHALSQKHHKLWQSGKSAQDVRIHKRLDAK